jgi:anaerobic magnesium-protoporphyrin IX monomethyl ester cyclase
MIDLLLIYPYFNDDHSIFKFPPLGLGYIASYVRKHGYSVAILDCTFTKEREAVAKARSLSPRVVGVYSMLGMKDMAIRIARQLRAYSEMLVVGGPLPTTSPDVFLEDFDVALIGEGEETILEILGSLENGTSLSKVEGIAYKEEKEKITVTSARPLRRCLDSLPFPARDLYEHGAYKDYFCRYHGYTTTSMITSRGCPFDCDFCSRPVFGRSYRGRSPSNIVDEMETVLDYGYDRIWFADDIFPIDKESGLSVCNEIISRRLDASWECLCRADVMNREIALKMKKAGCFRVFFGLESGNDRILKAMNKRLTVEQARRAVKTVKSVEIKAGAFFILGYPGETDDTMLDTLRFATSLPLDYFSFTVPYPLLGTGLYAKLKDKMTVVEWKKPRFDPVKHTHLYKSEFSMGKLKFGMGKAKAQRFLWDHLGPAYPFAGKPFEFITDTVFRAMK